MHDDHNPLPDVLEAHWDREQIDALFNDLAAGAEVRHVQVRRATDQGPQDIAVPLEEAKALLDDNATKAIQIHYRFDGQNWCDTLFTTADSIHIVRSSGVPLT